MSGLDFFTFQDKIPTRPTQSHNTPSQPHLSTTNTHIDTDTRPVPERLAHSASASGLRPASNLHPPSPSAIHHPPSAIRHPPSANPLNHPGKTTTEDIPQPKSI
ncbi:hypothetical protein PAAG_00082 [Paracoccidioides lutzii Pb01]|uniref:Uncharacterized protein n=1 Tax=Paracoccidioides lutzii (strain ATCC MYA-826 / Pb01) TaxID=502779 RepID=C1GNI7_PARBA|nr:hypothetical protein PAAG_00082 [Paracoccidioides lutzii Pb01]EEH35759.2 hypothetical protein PAAG_00082 [Paracoccidioides lutzii Pb01]